MEFFHQVTSDEFPTFGTEHLIYLFVSLAIWLALPYLGKHYLNPSKHQIVVFTLIFLTLFQEVIFDIFQVYINDFDIADDITLHMCGLSLLLTSYALWKKSQAAFELSYFWGLAGAFQAIITPDPTRWQYGDISIFWNFLSHGIIILNVIWLIWVDGMRCRKGSLLNTVLVTNGVIFIIGIINKLLGNGANYWFICEKPGGDSPFLIGDWPYYLITFHLAGILVMAIIYLPMWIVVNRQKKTRDSSPELT